MLVCIFLIIFFLVDFRGFLEIKKVIFKYKLKLNYSNGATLHVIILPKETVGRVRAMLISILTNDNKEDDDIEEDGIEDD